MNGRQFHAARQGAAAYWLRLPGNVRGAAWMMISGLLFTGMSSLVKDLGTRYDTFQVAFFRCLFGLIVLLPLILPNGIQAFRTRRPVLHLFRGLVGVSAMAAMFYGLTHLPLADVTAISFGVPLFLIILAVLFLGERIRWRRSTATVVGFTGVIIMMRPGAATIEPAALIVVSATLLMAVAATMMKLLSRTESTLTMIAWFGVIASCVMAIPAVLVWQTPTLQDWGWLALVGALGSAAQTCLVRAYTVGEATAVAPFDYVKLIYAVLVGITIFGEWPDEWTVVGALIIVGSALYIARREAKLDKSQRLATPSEPDSGAGHHPS